VGLAVHLDVRHQSAVDLNENAIQFLCHLLKDESECPLGMGDGETSSPAGLYFIADDAEHDWESVREPAVIFTGPPFRHVLGMTDGFLFVFPPCLLRLFCRSLRFTLANGG
jgi:hypothetical protein